MIASFFGIAGGTVAMPILFFSGYTPVTAVATSSMVNTGASLSGTLAHFRLKNIAWKTAIIIGLSGLISARLFHPFVLTLESRGWDKWFVPGLYISVLFCLIITLLASSKNKYTEKDARHSTPIAIGLGFAAGFLSITIGVGGGFLIAPLLMKILKFQPNQAVGTSIFSILFIAISGFSLYAMSGHVNFYVGTALIIGTILGSQIGARTMKYFNYEKISYLLSGLYSTIIISQLMRLVDISTIGIFIFSAYCLFVIVWQCLAPFQHEKASNQASASERK